MASDMTSVSNARREVDDHEEKDNPHAGSASIEDTASTAEIREQALAYDLIGL